MGGVCENRKYKQHISRTSEIYVMLLAKTKKYKQDFNDPWNFLLHAPPWHSSNPHQICWDILLQGIVFIKCFILMQTDEKHPVSRIVHSQLTPHQICCTAVVAKQKIQVFVLFDYFGEFIVPCRGKWLLKEVPKMLSNIAKGTTDPRGEFIFPK